MLRREIEYFFTALMFYTRIPIPAWVRYSDERLNKSRKYFPLIGWIIGGLGAGVFGLAHYLLPLSVSVLLSMAATVYWTGAFHEDGFADTCDAFGGGWTKAQILMIMKDSRVGAFGMVGFLLLFALKFAALYEIALKSAALLPLVLLNGHTLSRFIASTFIQTHDYVQDLDKSKAKPIMTRRLSGGEMAFSAVFVLLAGGLLSPPAFLVAAALAYGSKVWLGTYFQRHIGGYTGDCLGATQQVSEVVFYLSLLALWKFI
mgnify:CR=1 FL=1